VSNDFWRSCADIITYIITYIITDFTTMRYLFGARARIRVRTCKHVQASSAASARQHCYRRSYRETAHPCADSRRSTINGCADGPLPQHYRADAQYSTQQLL